MGEFPIIIEVANFSQSMPHLEAKVRISKNGTCRIIERTGWNSDPFWDKFAMDAARKLAAEQAVVEK